MASPKTYNQIYKEQGTIYNPQVKSVQSQMGLIPGTVAANIGQADALKTQAFDEILGGARQRGLGFAGIPLGEQAKYASTVYAPSVLRYKQEGEQQRMSLQDAILGIRERQANASQGLYQQGYANWMANRQFKEGQRQFNASHSLASRSAGGGGGGGGMSLGGFGGFGGGAPATKSASTGITGKVNVKGLTGTLAQQAYNDVYSRVSGQDDAALKSDYLATASSARYGNTRDLAKLQIYRMLRPDIFKFAYGWE